MAIIFDYLLRQHVNNVRYHGKYDRNGSRGKFSVLFKTRTRVGESSQIVVRRRSLVDTILHRVFSSSPPERNVDYRTDGGVVEGVWIFCRHGDRSPGRVLSPAHRRNEEGAFWTSRLPFPDSITAFSAYCKNYPPNIHPGTNEGEFLDSKRNPYGFLTQKGLSQLKENGHRFFNRYDTCGRHLSTRSHWRWENAQDFLEVWNVKAYSTNYIRTILSAQSFLDGLLGTHCFSPSAQRSLDSLITKEQVVPDHNWVKETFHENSEQDNQRLVPVKVRKISHDPLNAFDRNPDMMAEYVGEVMKKKEFHARDSAAAPLAARLSNILPGLIRPHRSGFSSRSPSGINWVEAADHFVCRESHELRLSKYSNFEDDDRVEQTLKAMSLQTKVHLSWRFRQWYQHRHLLAAIAAPPLREILNQMVKTMQLKPSDLEKRPFTLYSCHDITILGLLYGIGADFLADETVPGWDFWPAYGSTLVFELVRTTTTGKNTNCNDGRDDKNMNTTTTTTNRLGGGGGNVDEDDDEFVLRILLLNSGGGQRSNRIVECVDFADSSFPVRGTGLDGMMRVQDLEQLVEGYENSCGVCAKIHHPES